MIAMGYIPKNPLELLGITKGYGWSMDDFVQAPQPMPNQQQSPMDMSVVTGQEAAVAAER